MNFRKLILASMLALPIASPAALAVSPTPVAPAVSISEAGVAPTANLAATRTSALEERTSYAARESAAADLEEFSGGHGAIYLLLVVVLVVILLVILL